MAIPTNPSLDQEWTNDETGVTYKWDGERWFIISTSESELEEFYVTKVDFNADQDRQDTALAEDQERQDTQFTEDQQRQDTEFAEGQERQDDEIESIQAGQVVQDGQINALETQIQLLAQTQAVGKWTYQRNISGSVRPPASRTFYGTDKDGPTTNVLTDWANLQLLMVDKTDIDGTVYTFSEFEEGDKVEILATDGSSACFGTVTNDPNNESYGNMVVGVERSNGGPTEGKEYLLSVYRPGSNGGEVDLDVLDERYVIKTGDTMTGTLTGNLIKSIRETGYAFEVKPGNTDTKSFIRHDGTSQFTRISIDTDLTDSSGRGFEIKGRKSDGSTVTYDFFYMYNNADGTPSALNYKGKMDSEFNIVNKGYVDSVVGSGVPVGSIMIWMGSTAPNGWFKLQGGSFSTSTYPLLHAYLQGTSGYTSGKLPNWSGHYPGEYGDHITNNLGSKQGARTAQPSGGAPRSTSNSIPTGATRTFTATGNTNAYSNGQGRVTIGDGWDSTTRPKTVVVHYIIKHD